MHTHPLHIHLVRFKILGRGPDGSEAPAPNERVGKDTVRVNPGETVRILVKFGDFPGQCPWHCHVLEHENHQMMRPFEVVRVGSDDTGSGGGNSGNGDGKGNGNSWNDGQGDA
jgi:spore coat protein A